LLSLLPYLQVSATSDRVTEVLQSGLVQWHLTGLGVHNDPASLEHFGISIVEGMSTGCVPVAYTGGAEDIIQHGHDGYVATSSEEVMQFTRSIFSMSAIQQKEMQERVREKSHQFEFERFEQRFHNLVRTTDMIRPKQPISKSVLASWRK
jgi:glycosyltransferase involved in cell wall biosynthesis